MANLKVSHRYATSLIETAIEKNKLDKVSSDMILLLEALKDSKQLKLMLDNPVIRPELKEKILKEIFTSKFDSDSLNFLSFVIEKKRENLLDSIAERFLALRDEHLGIISVTVTTAFKFEDSQIEKLQKKLEEILGKKVRLNLMEDESLVGGFIAKAGDTMYDASVRHQLELLKKQFLVSGFSLN
ncbi:MAG: ATP synthase F1 subunit delta [Ignavibacteria bacterium]|nr:ATP synthase F1 subunit delta [Ignavibacteria bacterium]